MPRSILPPPPLPPLPLDVSVEVTRMAVTAVPGTVTQHASLNGFLVYMETQHVVERSALECNTNKLGM